MHLISVMCSHSLKPRIQKFRPRVCLVELDQQAPRRCDIPTDGLCPAFALMEFEEKVRKDKKSIEKHRKE